MSESEIFGDSIRPDVLEGEEKILLLRQIKMQSGLTLYNELIANFVSHRIQMDVGEVFSVLIGSGSQPMGFADECREAGRNLESYFNNTSKEKYYIYKQIERYKHVNRLYSRFIKYCENCSVEYDQNRFITFIKSTDLINRISNPDSEKKYEEGFYGDLEKVLFEAIVFQTPIDLVKIQCMRLNQLQDNDGRHRLRISTSVGVDRVETRGGKVKDYEDTTKLLEYLNYTSHEFATIGIVVRPIVLITDDDPRNMYGDDTVVPQSDIVQIEKDVNIYLSNLRKYVSQVGCNVEIYLISHVSSGSRYEEVKKLVCEDCIAGGKNLNPIVPEGEFTSAVESDQEKYGSEMKYSVPISKRKVGNMFGVYRALHPLAISIKENRGSNVVYIVRDKPYVNNHMAVGPDGDKRNRTPTLLAHSEGKGVFYSKGKF
ncbi:MAG TPA: hypothetical protein PLV59_00890 [Candidatus Dojkabacteria bacterium]|nr:hypothetical protein [Candidatus Dojkabacteria bacterium]